MIAPTLSPPAPPVAALQHAFLAILPTVAAGVVRTAGVRLAAEECRLVVEPSGALSIAALAYHAGELGLDRADGPVVAVVSGGNVDPDRYLELLVAPLPDRG